jgi:hypothetical protein
MSQNKRSAIKLAIANQIKITSSKRNQIPATVKTAKTKTNMNKNGNETIDYTLYNKNVNLLIHKNICLIANIHSFSSLIFDFLEKTDILR